MLNLNTIDFHFKAIGQVRSCFTDKFGTPRQPGLTKHSRAFLQIFSENQPELSLQGLAEFSHLWVIFVFHKNNSKKFHSKVHPPRLGGEKIGVFSTRSPHRPNPIGLSLVEIDNVEGGGIWVRGIDLIEGTPVLDIKPYIPSVEAQPEAHAGWVQDLAENDIQLEWTAEAENNLIQLGQANLKLLIEETLQLDPRPRVYKGYEGKKSKYRDEHIVKFYQFDVYFNFKASNLISVNKIIDTLK
ncbi:MAG: tRNA (N6-threonylcarbamoyladenosine(37)-N6)-methyltransferase TrmO [Bdellovibrionaceae bacterium]|nr:tRNA (N6-threonylcarbamoyladenosine(37)-N6)-methyltransferase TrmO [Pseudobdellovibrionaceae bacterium]